MQSAALGFEYTEEEIEQALAQFAEEVEYERVEDISSTTAEKVAGYLKDRGLDVKTGVAHTGVVGLLKGGRPGPVVALPADMDAQPVTERGDLPFASKVRAEYNGQVVGMMHACGHDTHTAILMGVAEILASMKEDLTGSVKFIFQPAEEGPPQGEEGGAGLMIKEGVLENPKVDVIWPAPIAFVLQSKASRRTARHLGRASTR